MMGLLLLILLSEGHLENIVIWHGLSEVWRFIISSSLSPLAVLCEDLRLLQGVEMGAVVCVARSEKGRVFLLRMLRLFDDWVGCRGEGHLGKGHLPIFLLLYCLRC